ncbi:MAG: hypothetical protein GF320_17275 [Armatimonadia bacterium]|nr:hypothetical protein [Armatimonadia bacterium]
MSTTLLALSAVTAVADLSPARGEWIHANELGPVVIHRGTGDALALSDERVAEGAFRALVEPSLSLPACGIVVLADAEGNGYRCGIGGEDPGGFWLSGPESDLLWSDATAPISPYGATWVEAVIEDDRLRVQLLDWDGETLISQSPWIELPGAALGRAAGVFASGGPARFRQTAAAAEPLSPVVDDPPNLRRLGNDPDWVLQGGGLWMWASGDRNRVQQTKPTDRAYAMYLPIQGTHRTWRTAVRVHPGTGGAGMYFQIDEQREKGLLCWLGGTHGAGCLMLYQHPHVALWSGPSDMWHYDTDYVLEAESRTGQVKVRLLDAAGEVLSESPWVATPEEYTDREGYLGFHTWLGTAEFWGFREDAEIEGRAADQGQALGAGWVAQAGKWSVTAEGLSLTAGSGACVNRDISGSKGRWSVRVVTQPTEPVRLMFQAAADRETGFALEVTSEGARLLDLSRPGEPRWQSTDVTLADAPFSLEGIVETDRVRVRVLRGDEVLVESPTVYVTDRNNARVGYLGVTAEGPVTLTDWSFEPGE